jgi:hypothetical protein
MGEMLHRPQSSSISRRILARSGFDLGPVVSTAGSIGGAEALRHDTFAAERAGVLEDDRPVGGILLVEGDTFVGVNEKLRQDALVLLDRRGPQVLGRRVRAGREYRGGVVTVSADQVENGKAAFVADDGLRRSGMSAPAALSGRRRPG